MNYLKVFQFYFFKKAIDSKDLKFEEKDFKYPGPKPFSKETAILMMADSVEAASKSLRDRDIDQISNFVNSIIDKQVEEKQFSECQITFADIETVKKVYMAGWKSGCKGITIYRDGCRSGVLVSSELKNNESEKFCDHHALRRPEILECEIKRLKLN